jgi:hypothetical protein
MYVYVLNERRLSSTSYEVLTNARPTREHLLTSQRRLDPASTSGPVDIRVEVLEPLDRSPALFLTTWRVANLPQQGRAPV